MKFIERGHRQAPTVIIVALIDILIVLLIFLIVTTTFKQQPSLKLSLPESKQAQKGVAEKGVVTVVEVDNKAPYLRLDSRALSTDRLQQELAARAKRDPRMGLAIRADAQAPFEQIIKVMDMARGVGITNFSAYVKTPGSP